MKLALAAMSAALLLGSIHATAQVIIATPDGIVVVPERRPLPLDAPGTINVFRGGSLQQYSTDQRGNVTDKVYDDRVWVVIPRHSW